MTGFGRAGFRREQCLWLVGTTRTICHAHRQSRVLHLGNSSGSAASNCFRIDRYCSLSKCTPPRIPLSSKMCDRNPRPVLDVRYVRSLQRTECRQKRGSIVRRWSVVPRRPVFYVYLTVSDLFRNELYPQARLGLLGASRQTP